MSFPQSGLPLVRVTLLVSILSSVFATSVAPVDSQTNSGSEVTDHAGRLLSQPPIGLDRLLSQPPIVLDRLYSQPPIGLDRLYSQPPIVLDRLLSQSTRQAERESSLPDSADTGRLLSEARRQIDGESDRLISRVPRPEDSTTGLLHSTDRLLSPASSQVKVNLLQGVLSAIEKLLDFFQSDFSDINVDGLFGIRLAQGSIHGALKDCYSRQLDCPKLLREKLEKFITIIDYVSKKAEPYIEAQDSGYFHRFHNVIGEEYSLDYRPELLLTAHRVPPNIVEYDENKGDHCLNLLSGTGSVGGRPVAKCTITEECWEYMTTPDLDDYFVTHQLLYFIFIDKNGCLEAAREFDPDHDPDVLRKEERKLCTNILGEVRSEFNHEFNNVDMMQQDLFLEQTVLCGVLGFEDFFQDQYIETVLSWQYPTGCFAMSPSLAPKALDPEPVRTAVRKLMRSLRREAQDIENSPTVVGTARKLMRETFMEGQCLSHKTGLACGTLGAYLRYLMDVLYSQTPHRPITPHSLQKLE